ncbi:MAG: DegT/DnrJ/EryC1/StrS family aminotransferase [Acidimicrobiales bacterium]
MTTTLSIPIAKTVTGPEEEAAVAAVLRSGWLTQGNETFEFERRVAHYCGAAAAVAANSATTALHLAMVMLGIGPGDEVLVPSYTHIATANSVRYTGATPVFVDIRADTNNIDERLLGQALTPRTRAIVVVHQVGLPAEMDDINTVAADHGLAVVEDAACAIGSTYRGRRVGSLSPLTVFSFHPRKIITTGEGGMLLTGDAEQAELARSLASHGESVLDVDRHGADRPVQEGFSRVGFNYRMTNIQGAIGVVQMDRLDAILADRRRLGRRYSELLGPVPGVEPPVEPEHVETNYQSYLVTITDDAARSRDEVMVELRRAGIATRPGVTAIHHQEVYAGTERAPLPVTDEAVANRLILPLYPQMTGSEQDEVAGRLAELVGG